MARAPSWLCAVALVSHATPQDAQPETARQAAKEAAAARGRMKKAAPESEDPQLAEFLALMAPRKQQKLWADYATGAAAAAAVAAAGDAGARDKPTRCAASARVVDDDDGEEVEEADEEYQELGGGGGGGRPLPPRVDEPGLTDLDYLRSRVKADFSSDSDEGDESDGDEEEKVEADGARAADAGGGDADESAGGAAEAPADAGGGSAAPPPPLLAHGRLFVRNLCYTATEEELRQLFAPFGALTEMRVVSDRRSGRSTGLAFAKFARDEDAATAMAALDGSSFQGRLLHVLPAQAAPGGVALNPDGTPFVSGGANGATPSAASNAFQPGSSSAYKSAKAAALKASAADPAGWSTLFVRPDAVASSLAAQHGVSKADVLLSSAPGASPAARLALGEAQAVAATKKELAAAGVNVAALEAAAAAPRGGPPVLLCPATLLLKNLPHAADGAALRAAAERFGPLASFVLPSTSAFAIAQFLEPSAARAAFAGLAYRRFGGAPLYVQWAPAGMMPLDTPLRPPQPAAPAATPAKPVPVSAAEAAGVATAAQPLASGCTLYVKNLAFATTDAGLRAAFEAHPSLVGRVRAATVTRKPGKQRPPPAPPPPMLSCGYGFVELDSAGAAAEAARAVDGVALDGHALRVTIASGREGAPPGGAAAAPGLSNSAASSHQTKLVVRNVAFEATKADIRALFSPFGSVKSVRLPRKMDGQHRGFAFVEMGTKAEAAAAFDAVGGTHLYGRHLVTQWAEADGGVEEVREKTAARFEAASGRADAAGGKRARR